MPFRIFPYIDAALLEQEKRTERASQVPAVWPSEASAELLDKSLAKIVGKCMRASYYRMTGVPITNQIDPVGAWRWTTGRMIEGHLVDLCRNSRPNIYVANGVRTYVDDLRMPLELDIVVADPQDNYRAWIAECKTYYGLMAKMDIEMKGKPKLENIIQDCLYLLEFPTGAHLKKAIRQGIEERAALDLAPGVGKHRNRIECNLEMLDKLNDGPAGAKLVYVSRDECQRTEFDVTIQEDYDGFHYPAIDGQMWKLFSIESIYERFKVLQGFWYRARRAGVERLEAKDVRPPVDLHLVLSEEDERRHEGPLSDEQKEAHRFYLDKLEAEVRKLPDEFLPPAEYEWAYSNEKIEDLHGAGLIGKERYARWSGKTPTGRVSKRKDRLKRIGDWQCMYCAYNKVCVPKQDPTRAYEVYEDLRLTPEETAELTGVAGD